MRQRAVAAALSLALTSCTGIGARSALSDAQQVIADTKIGPSDLSIVGSVDRKDRSYRSGDKITVSFAVDKPAYVAVLRVLRNGETIRVFPNKDRPNALVPANTRVDVPAAGDAVAITAGKPGVELFEFVASTDGSSFLFKTPATGSAVFAEYGSTTRSITKEIVTSLHGRQGAETGAAHQIVEIDD